MRRLHCILLSLGCLTALLGLVACVYKTSDVYPVTNLVCYAIENQELFFTIGFDAAALRRHWRSYGKPEAKSMCGDPSAAEAFLETLNATPESELRCYAKQNADVRAGVRGPELPWLLHHWLTFGKKEGRELCSRSRPKHFWWNEPSDHLKPLPFVVRRSEPRRINIVMTGLGKDLTGGPLSILQFAAEIIKAGQLGVRFLNADGVGIDGSTLYEHLKLYEDLNVLNETTFPFVMDAPNAKVIYAHPSDLCMATLYYTAQICHATTLLPDVKQKNFLYFVQDFEPIFFPTNSRYIEAMESYKFPHFAIYSTAFLRTWFREQKIGPYAYMFEPDSIVYASEPAIAPWGKFEIEPLKKRGRKRRLLVYARKHADRNAFELTLSALASAVCENVFTPLDQWEFIGLGALVDEEFPLGATCRPDEVNATLRVRKNIPRPLYRKLVRTGDIGFSLMMSPHPSLPPFDFAAAGLVTVTNSFWTKTAESFRQVSTNFEVAPPSLRSLVRALRRAAGRSLDYEARKRGADMIHWEKAWNGDKCYGPTLMNTIHSKWQKMHRPLWTVPKSSLVD